MVNSSKPASTNNCHKLSKTIPQLAQTMQMQRMNEGSVMILLVGLFCLLKGTKQYGMLATVMMAPTRDRRGPASSSETICITDTPVILSPDKRQVWIGVAPLYFGNREG
eukprot:122891_1